MNIIIREYNSSDIEQAIRIWNGVVRAGDAFPQTDELNILSGNEFFCSQSRTAVAEDREKGDIVGLYILHPNNVGRCKHICNASYAVSPKLRGNNIGSMLVEDSLKEGRRLGFRILQFNAVVKDNLPARHIYEKLGFILIGEIPEGFRADNGYKNICLYYHIL